MGGIDHALRRQVIAALDHHIPAVNFGSPLREDIRRVAAKNPDLAMQLLRDRVHPGPADHLVMGSVLPHAWQSTHRPQPCGLRKIPEAKICFCRRPVGMGEPAVAAHSCRC